MNGQHPKDIPKPPNIHRRIVAYGLLVILGAIAWAVLVSTRYQVNALQEPRLLVRYDRWTGKVQAWSSPQGGWDDF